MSFYLISGSNTKHISKEPDSLKPLCGARINRFCSNDGTEVKIDETDKELKEFWTSPIQKHKWVRVSRNQYCKTCLKLIKHDG